jgi:mRNA-degrading endonuclease RelE of RelBE toxin-antitoxin system
MELDIKLENPCKSRKPFCINCHNHFLTIRPKIKGVVVSKHFIKDLKDQEKITSIIQDILDCSSSNFIELHKFEEHINGNLVFRAKTEKFHIVYCIDKHLRIIFLRAFNNYTRYKKFLDNKHGIRHMIPHV